MRIAVIGAGYVGLVTGTCLAEVGNHVVCVDIDAVKVAQLQRGEIPIFEPGLAPLVRSNQNNGQLRFTDDAAAALAQAQASAIPPWT